MSNVFVPPVFKDHGKAAKDLLSKKYSFERKLTLKSAASNGVSFETSASSTASGYVAGAEGKHVNAEHGTFEVKYGTAGSTDASWETDKLHEGFKLKVSVNEKPTGTADVTYTKDSTALTASVSSSGKATSVTAAAVVGFDGVSVGGEVVYDAAAQAVSDYNAAAQYSQDDFTVGLKTSNQADDVCVSFIHKVSPTFTFGGQATYNIASGARTLTAGGEHKLNDAVTIKGKANNAGTVTWMVEHSLPNAAVVRLTTEFDANTYSTVPDKFGLGIIFGDN